MQPVVPIYSFVLLLVPNLVTAVLLGSVSFEDVLLINLSASLMSLLYFTCRFKTRR